MPTGFSLVHITNFSSHLVSLNPASPRSTVSLCLFLKHISRSNQRLMDWSKFPPHIFSFSISDYTLHNTEEIICPYKICQQNHSSISTAELPSAIFDVNISLSFLTLVSENSSQKQIWLLVVIYVQVTQNYNTPLEGCMKLYISLHRRQKKLKYSSQS